MSECQNVPVFKQFPVIIFICTDVCGSEGFGLYTVYDHAIQTREIILAKLIFSRFCFRSISAEKPDQNQKRMGYLKFVFSWNPDYCRIDEKRNAISVLTILILILLLGCQIDYDLDRPIPFSRNKVQMGSNSPVGCL
ncbi:hypothetical protein BOV88_13550 [Solemya velum gill symbiont]|uniref:Uncharacterized protein n=1 Tax=Solemya velum gill symbiont TaxID=2340 RepID=A0A1T2CG41_SOVGS|nr:hypothetical protein BOV88_13550 [Solemya velum gill symbiont]